MHVADEAVHRPQRSRLLEAPLCPQPFRVPPRQQRLGAFVAGAPPALVARAVRGARRAATQRARRAPHQLVDLVGCPCSRARACGGRRRARAVRVSIQATSRTPASPARRDDSRCRQVSSMLGQDDRLVAPRLDRASSATAAGSRRRLRVVAPRQLHPAPTRPRVRPHVERAARAVPGATGESAGGGHSGWRRYAASASATIRPIACAHPAPRPTLRVTGSKSSGR